RSSRKYVNQMRHSSAAILRVGRPATCIARHVPSPEIGCAEAAGARTVNSVADRRIV
ncbi:unnamed protein product, partial [Nesidiocoris tenuis]